MPARVVYVYDDLALYALGATAVATVEDTDNPASNLVHPDRGRRYRTTASPPGTVNLDITFATAPSISGYAICRMISDAAAGSKPALEIKSGPNAGSLTSRATIVGTTWNTAADKVDTFAGTFTDLFWRLIFTSVTTRFSVGKVILGTGSDFGQLYSDGSAPIIIPGTRLTGVPEQPIDILNGEPGRAYEYKYRTAISAEQTGLERLAQQKTPFGLLDSRGNSAQVVLAEGRRTDWNHVFGDTWEIVLRMGQLVG